MGELGQYSMPSIDDRAQTFGMIVIAPGLTSVWIFDIASDF